MDYVGRVCVGGCCGRWGFGLAPGVCGVCGLGCAGEASRGRSLGLPGFAFFAVLIAHLRVVRDRLDALSSHWIEPTARDRRVKGPHLAAFIATRKLARPVSAHSPHAPTLDLPLTLVKVVDGPGADTAHLPTGDEPGATKEAA